MERAILLKEWIKTRRVFMLCLILSVAMAVYAVLRVNRLIELKGAQHLWLIMLLKDNTFADVIKWTPVLCGVAVALAQMAPEMIQKRLKLTLHLPYSQNRMILMMIGLGISQLLVIYLIQTAIIGIYDMRVLPSRLVARVVLTMLPWYYAGFTAYLFTASVCIEGMRMRRVVLALLGIAFVMVFYEQTATEAYNGMMPLALLFIAFLFMLPLGSVKRFKEGLQS